MIDIGTVLQKFDDTYDDHNLQVKEYGIRFITSDGRLRTMRARKNVASPQRGLNKPHQARGKFRFNLKRNGTMLLSDLDLNESRAVKVAAICGFRDFKKTEWQNVRH